MLHVALGMAIGRERAEGIGQCCGAYNFWRLGALYPPFHGRGRDFIDKSDELPLLRGLNVLGQRKDSKP